MQTNTNRSPSGRIGIGCGYEKWKILSECCNNTVVEIKIIMQ